MHTREGRASGGGALRASVERQPPLVSAVTLLCFFFIGPRVVCVVMDAAGRHDAGRTMVWPHLTTPPACTPHFNFLISERELSTWALGPAFLQLKQLKMKN